MSESLRLLIVDDEPGLVQTLVDILTLHDHQVEGADSGSEALEKLKASQKDGRPFDCVFTDVRMPSMNGIELHQAIKALQPELPVVLMTAYAHDSLIKEGLREGILAVLDKPLIVPALLSFLRTLAKGFEVVLVDDDPGFRQTMRDLIQNTGIAVAEVENPLDWVRDFQPEGCQIVLLDLKLNGIDGLDILKQLQTEHPHLDIILVTGYLDEIAPTILADLEIQKIPCLEKPLNFPVLQQHLVAAHRQSLIRSLEPLPGR
ncbi:MAG: response regulator [Acidobacteriota bacterium]